MISIKYVDRGIDHDHDHDVDVDQDIDRLPRCCRLIRTLSRQLQPIIQSINQAIGTAPNPLREHKQQESWKQHER